MSTNLSKEKREKILNNIKIMRSKLQENPELLITLNDIETELKKKKIWISLGRPRRKNRQRAFR